MATDHNFKVKKGLHVLGSEGIYLTDTNTRLHEGNGNALRITTDSGGYVDLGSMNSGWVHMQMNKNLYILPSSYVAIDGNLQPYTDSARTLGSDAYRWSHIYGDALTIGGNITSGGSVNIAGDLNIASVIAHTGDLDTYFQFNAANTARIVVGGSQKFVVNSSGVSISNGTLSSGDITSTGAIKNGSYTRILTGDSNTGQITFNANFSSGAYTPDYNGATQAGMSVIKMKAGGYGGLEFYVKNHGTATGTHALNTFTKVAEMHQSGYFDASNGLRVGGSTFADTSRNITAGTISSGAITSTGAITGAQDFKATGNNMKLHAGGNHIINIDLNGNFYPQTHNAVDLGFSDTLAFRNLHLVGAMSGGASIASGNITATGSVTAKGSSGGFFYAEDTTTSNVADDLIGGFLFKSNDGSGTTPHYAGMTARAHNIYGALQLEFFADRADYENDTPGMVFKANGTDSTANTLDLLGSTQIDNATAVFIDATNDSYNFKAFGQDTDSWFGVYDDANNSANIILTRSDSAEMFKVMGHTGATTINGTLDTGQTTVNQGQVWDATTQGQGKGSIHIDPNSGTDHAGGAITFGASDHSNGTAADAGIYIRSDGSYGTRMYLATTDSYASGSKTSVFIDSGGHTAITRGHFKMGTSTVISSNRDITNIKTIDVDPDANGPAVTLGRYSGQPTIKAKTDDGGYLIMDSSSNLLALNWYVNKNVVLVNGGGNVGIGLSSNISEKLHVNGNIRATGTVRANAVTYTGTDGTAGQVLTTDGSGGTSFTTVSGGAGKVDIGSGFANNRVLTSANSDTAQGEANLTFDGSTLIVNGNTRSNGMIVGANEAFDTTNLVLHVHGNQAIERNNALFLGVTGTNYNSWQAKLHNSGSTFYLNAQTFQFDNTGYGSDVFFLANSSGIDIKTGALKITGKEILDVPAGFCKNFATSHGWRAASTISSAPGYYGGNFGINGSSSENEIIYSTLPDGSSGLVWNTPSNDSASNADGGWNKNVTNLPSDDMSYMSVVYVRRNGSATGGSFYHGCSGSHTLNTSGTANTNPYFKSFGISNLPQDVWCVSIGFIRGNADSTSGNTYAGGCFRCDTGEQVAGTYTDYRMKDGSTEQTHRTYLYYSTNTSASLSWAKPGFYAIDGTEPTLQDLISPAANKGATFNDLVRINSTNNSALYINGNSGGIRFQGGNNRIYFNGHRALEGATDGGTLQIGEGYSLAQLQSTNTQLVSNAKLFFHGGTTYGIGAGGHNYNSGYFDTVESGINSDTLELCYYSGAGVRVGTAAAHKYLYAGAIRSYAQSSAWDANLRLYSSDGTNYWNILCDNGVNDTLRFAQNNVEKFRLESGRTYSPQFMQVGDGTTYASNDGSWGARLNVTDSVHSKIEVSQEANSMRSYWYAHTGHSTIKFGAQTNHGLELQTNGTTRINISNAGLIDMTGGTNVYLTNSTDRVRFNGIDFLSYGAGGHMWLIANSGAANSSRAVELNMGTEWDWDDQIALKYVPAASGTAGGIFYLGQLAKNSTAYNHTTTYFAFNGANRFKFENDGDFIATGNVTAYGSTSDIRLKENIEVIADPIEKVCKLKGVTFNYKEDGKRSTGLIAQDLEQVLPEAVYETEGMEKDPEDTYKAIRYGNVVGLLVEAIKEQQQQIDSLKEEINILKGEK